MADSNESAGLITRVLTQFPVRPAVADEQMAENIRSSVSRGLPEIEPKRAHKHRLSIAAGGPSLNDTWQDLSGLVAAVNGSLGFLLERGIKPWACGLFDPRPHLADVVDRNEDVFYFVGSTCHPRVFDKLDGCKVGIWHPLGMPGIEEIAPGAASYIGGGTTMGLRWLNIGYFLGFRDFHVHGLDSSFSRGMTHAYPDYTDGEPVQDFLGYKTRRNFLQQIDDWRHTKAMFKSIGDEPAIRLFGDGLLQYCESNGLC